MLRGAWPASNFSGKGLNGTTSRVLTIGKDQNINPWGVNPRLKSRREIRYKVLKR